MITRADRESDRHRLALDFVLCRINPLQDGDAEGCGAEGGREIVKIQHRQRKGSSSPAVLPVPFLALARMSRPASAIGMASSWIGEGACVHRRSGSESRACHAMIRMSHLEALLEDAHQEPARGERGVSESGGPMSARAPYSLPLQEVVLALATLGRGDILRGTRGGGRKSSACKCGAPRAGRSARGGVGRGLRCGGLQLGRHLSLGSRITIARDPAPPSRARHDRENRDSEPARDGDH